MQLFLHLIVLLPIIFVHISNGNYLLCTSPFYCPRFTVSFSDPLTLPTECQENNNNSVIFERAFACGIEYRIDYDSQRVYIDFLINNTTSSLEGHHQYQSLGQLLWLGFNRHTNQPNITQRRYLCNTQDDCARQFYLSTIKRLIDEGKFFLDKIQTILYKESLLKVNARRRCTDSSRTDNRTSVKCPDGLCFAYEANIEGNNRQEIEEKQSCRRDKLPGLFSEIQIHSPFSPTSERRVLDYRCNKNVCNRNDFIEKVQLLIDNYTQWNEPKTILIEKTSPTKSLANLRTVISFCLFFFLMIIIQLF